MEQHSLKYHTGLAFLDKSHTICTYVDNHISILFLYGCFQFLLLLLKFKKATRGHLEFKNFDIVTLESNVIPHLQLIWVY